MSEIPAAQHAHDGYVDPNDKAKRGQSRGWLVVTIVAVIGGSVLIWNMFKPPSAAKAEEARKIAMTAEMALPSERSAGVKAEELSVKLDSVTGDYQSASAKAQQLQSENDALKAQLQANDENAKKAIDIVQSELENLRQRSQEGQQGGAPQVARQGGNFPTPSAGPGEGGQGAPPTPVRPRRKMQVVRVDTGPVEADDGQSAASPASAAAPASGGGAAAGAQRQGQFVTSPAQIIDTRFYVPPNAYVKARVLVGVDAAAGVAQGADPKPVLFRLIGPARHVGSGQVVRTIDLTGCQVNGAAYGELSSEKVYIKLQRITCDAGKDRVAVAAVEGYVSHKGKAGVRGQVISRQGGLAGRAMIAGTLSGLGRSLEKYTERMSSTFGLGADGVLSGPPRIDPGDAAAGAAGSGVAGASEMLAQYYIKRAEQYQPVIEMPTGVDVELVFLSGFQVKAVSK